MKLIDDETVIPIDDFLIEAFNNKNDLNYIDSLQLYLSENRRKYCLVSLSSISAVLWNYRNEILKQTK